MKSATVLITTKNRRDLLARAVYSALAQKGDIEVIVIDDGSTDGTSEMIMKRFPSVKLVTHSESLGYVVRRNEGVRLASAPFVFSIDDDAEYTDEMTVQRALQGFDIDDVWAIALPYINVLQEKTIRQRPLGIAAAEIIAFYTGTAHAVRRDEFLSVGGYRNDIVHQGEEGDIAIRMLERRKFVRVVETSPIHHLETPRRNFARLDYYGSRNALLFGWRNVPFPECIGQVGMTTVNIIRHAARLSRPRRDYLRGAASAFKAMAMREVERCPVSRRTFWTFRWLVQQPRSLEEARRRLEG